MLSPTPEDVARVAVECPEIARCWREMGRCPQPRNVRSILDAKRAGTLGEGAQIIVSFVGGTGFSLPHLFVDSGKRYDLRCAANLHVHIFTRPGVDARSVIGDLWHMVMPYPDLIDVDRQVVASIVEDARGGLKLWPRRKGSDSWHAVFG